MARQHGRVQIAADAQLGLGWYSPESWERLAELADDRDALDESFEAWERGARAALMDLEGIGRHVVKVPVDVEAMAAWCRDTGRRFDSAARAEYVSERLRERVQDH